MTPHRDPLAAALARAEAAEAALARRLAEAMEPVATRPLWLPGDYLAAPVIIGGYPVGIVLTCLGIGTGSALALGVALALGAVWWLLALRWCSRGAP